MIRVVVREVFANRSILTISLQRNLVRENRSQGSVTGDGSNAIPYLEISSQKNVWIKHMMTMEL